MAQSFLGGLLGISGLADGGVIRNQPAEALVVAHGEVPLTGRVVAVTAPPERAS